MLIYMTDWLNEWNEWLHKGEETKPPSRKIPNSLSKPKCLHYFYLTINKMLHTLHYGTYVNQTGIQYQITFNNLGAQLYQVGRQALVLHRRNARTPSSCLYRKELETGTSERSEGKAWRPGSSPGTSEPWLTGRLVKVACITGETGRVPLVSRGRQRLCVRVHQAKPHSSPSPQIPDH